MMKIKRLEILFVLVIISFCYELIFTNLPPKG